MAQVLFKISELNELINNSDSGVTLVPKCCRQIIVSQYQLANLKQFIKDYLYSTIAKFDSHLDAIVLSYKKISIEETFTFKNDGTARLHYTADIYAFKPKYGSIISGVINKKSGDHLGCLVHKVFNVAIPRPSNEDASSWIGTKLKIGQEVQFKVTKFELNEDMPYIKGELIDNGLIKDVVDTNSKSKKKHERKTDVNEFENASFDENDHGFAEDISDFSSKNNSGNKDKSSKKKSRHENKQSNKIIENLINSNMCNENSSPLNNVNQSGLIANSVIDMYSITPKSKCDLKSKSSKKQLIKDLLDNSFSDIGESDKKENKKHKKQKSSVNKNDYNSLDDIGTQISNTGDLQAKTGQFTKKYHSLTDPDCSTYDSSFKVHKKKKKSKSFGGETDVEMFSNKYNKTNIDEHIVAEKDSFVEIENNSYPNDVNIYENENCVKNKKHKKKRRSSTNINDYNDLENIGAQIANECDLQDKTAEHKKSKHSKKKCHSLTDPECSTYDSSAKVHKKKSKSFDGDTNVEMFLNKYNSTNIDKHKISENDNFDEIQNNNYPNYANSYIFENDHNKKKKKKKDRKVDPCNENIHAVGLEECSPELKSLDEVKSRKHKHNETSNNLINSLLDDAVTVIEESPRRKKRKRKVSEVEDVDNRLNENKRHKFYTDDLSQEAEYPVALSKKRKKNKEYEENFDLETHKSKHKKHKKMSKDDSSLMENTSPTVEQSFEDSTNFKKKRHKKSKD